MKKIKIIVLILSVVFLFCTILKSEDITLGDVVAAQEENASEIQTMAAEVENEVEYGGNKQTLAYDYILQNNADGSKKMMVTTKGVFTIQFLVDTKEGSVTYLMANGTTKKFTLTPEEMEKINAQFSINSLQPRPIYAMGKGKGGSAIDGTYKTSLDTDTIETEDNIIKVERKKSSKDYAYVEYHNKKVRDIGGQIDEKIAKAEIAPATKEGAKRMKVKYIEQMKKNKGKIIKTTIAKRVEKINLKTGQVEESEFYNNNNERIGFTKIKQMRNVECRMPDKKTKKIIQIPTEVETEMEGINGKSKIKTRMKNVKVNEDVKFEWIKVGKK